MKTELNILAPNTLKSLLDLYCEGQPYLENIASATLADQNETFADCPSDFSWHGCYSVSLVQLITLLVVLMDKDGALQKDLESGKPHRKILEGLDKRNPVLRDDLGHWPAEYILLACLSALLHSIRSIAIHGWSVNALMDQYVKTADERARLLMIGIDPTVVNHSALQREISLARLRQDDAFFTQLGNKLKTRTKRQKQDHGALRFILAVLREAGDLDQRSAKENYELLAVELRLYPQTGADPVRGLERFIQRWKEETATNLSDFSSSPD